MEDRPRSPVRLLAPIALVAFAFALLVTVTGSEVGDDSSSSTETTERPERSDERERARDAELSPEDRREAQLPDEVYIVKPGDTLGTIAQKTGLTLRELQRLNPDVDPQALVSGQQIRLKE